MSAERSADEVLDRDFLPVRAKLLEIAAALDRVTRAEGKLSDTPRMDQIRAGIEALLTGDGDRAERIQQIFSLSYDDNWRREFKLAGHAEG